MYRKKIKYNPLPNRFKIVFEKKPLQTIKWWSDGMKIEDPILSAVNFNITDCYKWKKEERINVIVENKTEETHPNGTIYYIYKYKEEKYYVDVCVDKEKTIVIDGTEIKVKELEIGISKLNDTHFQVDDMYDGNGDGICQPGESCCIISDKVICDGHNKDKIKIRLKDKKIE